MEVTQEATQDSTQKATQDSTIGPNEEVYIAELYSCCLRSFGLLLVSLEAESCRAVQLGYIDSSHVVDEYGRLNVWGEQSRANLPARARGSLDDTLRNDDDVRSMVQGILLRLDAILGKGKSIEGYLFWKYM